LRPSTATPPMGSSTISRTGMPYRCAASAWRNSCSVAQAYPRGSPLGLPTRSLARPFDGSFAGLARGASQPVFEMASVSPLRANRVCLSRGA
jgi:hypothetical protein